jgi:gas vesicle protein
MAENRSDFFIGLLIGGIAGAILGILYAPKSGKETREELSKKTEDLIAKAKDDYERALAKSKKTYESAVQRLRELEETTKEKVVHVEEEVAGLADRGREAFHDSKSRLKKAIDAGVEVFREEKSS